MTILTILLAIAALLIALPATLQIYFGRPQLKVGFGFQYINKQKQFLCTVENPPINNRFLKVSFIFEEKAQKMFMLFPE